MTLALRYHLLIGSPASGTNTLADQVGISAEINSGGCGLRHRDGAQPASNPVSGGAAKGALDRL